MQIFEFYFWQRRAIPLLIRAHSLDDCLNGFCEKVKQKIFMCTSLGEGISFQEIIGIAIAAVVAMLVKLRYRIIR